jgi:hypothetical protein
MLGSARPGWASRAPGAGERRGLRRARRGAERPLDATLRERACRRRLRPGGAPPGREAAGGLPPLTLALLPIVLVIALNLAFTFARSSRPWTRLPRRAALTGDDHRVGARGVVDHRRAGDLAHRAVVLQPARLRGLTASLDSGANASVLPIFNTASLVGFGAVIASLAAFDRISDWVTSFGGDNPLSRWRSRSTSSPA